MSQPGALYQWTALIARQFPHLRASQAKVLAAFSWGVVTSRRCTLRLVAEALPQLGKPDTVERRLQRFVANPRVDWQAGATALARWVLRRFPARRPLVLLVDETSLHEALRVMVGGAGLVLSRAGPTASEERMMHGNHGKPPLALSVRRNAPEVEGLASHRRIEEEEEVTGPRRTAQT